MIKDLIVKLMEEANAEAEHKGFCDTELATNKQTRDNLSADVDELTASIEEKTAEISQLTTSIKELSDAIAEIKKMQAEATALRQEEKEKNMATIADAQEGTTAVEQALKVLKDFYEGAAAASLLQGGNGIQGAMAAMRAAQDAAPTLMHLSSDDRVDAISNIVHIAWVEASHGNPTISSHVDVELIYHPLNLGLRQAGEGEHTNLVRDMVPCTWGALCFKCLSQRRPHLQNPIRHQR